MLVKQSWIILIQILMYKSQQRLAHPSALIFNFVLTQIAVNNAHFFIAHQTDQPCMACYVMLFPHQLILRFLHFLILVTMRKDNVFFPDNQANSKQATPNAP